MSNGRWPTSSLKSLSSRIGDGIHGTPQYVENSDYPFINGNNLKGGFIEISQETKRVSRSEFEKHYIEFDEKTLFLSINGTLGSLAKYRGESVILGKSAAYIKCTKINVDFLYYYLQLKAIQQQMWNVATGSTIKNLSLESIRNLKIPTPSGTEQIRIAAILSTLDAKIDSNNRINAVLEVIAKTVYDYWFVQFDFPDANGQPYKSSCGKMVYDTTLKREIPAGWKAANILAVADLLGGGTPTKTKPEYWNGNIPFFTPTDADGTIYKFSTADYITEKGLNESSTKLFKKHTVFITARGSVGRLVFAGVDMAMNQSCYALRTKPGISHTYLFFLAKELIHHLQVKSSGSVFDSIVSNDIEFTNLAIPKDDVVKKFGVIVEPILERIANNTKENLQLTQLRDWLLPMLMNGQVTIK